MFHQSTNTNILLSVLILPKELRGISCFSLITRCQKLKVSPVSPDFRFEADWLKCAAPQTYFTLFALRYPICHSIPNYLQQRLLSGQPKAGIHSEQNKRWLADANFCKEFMCILNKTANNSGRPVPGIEPGTGGFSVFRVNSTRFVVFTTPNETCCPYLKLISLFQNFN